MTSSAVVARHRLIGATIASRHAATSAGIRAASAFRRVEPGDKVW